MEISIDESTYLSLAEVLSQGGRLYVDALDRKPPGLIWLYQAFYELFGWDSLHAIHLAIILLVLALGLLAARAAKTEWAFWLYILFSSALLRGVLAANAEYWMLMFLAPACYIAANSFLNQRSKTALRLGFATTLAAISCLFKQYGGFIYALFYITGVIIYLIRDPKILTAKLKIQTQAAFASFASLILVFGLTALYFYRQNSLSEFLYYFMFESFGYMGQNAAELNQQTKTFWIFMSILASWFPLWIFLVLGWLQKNRSAQLLLWSAGAAAALGTAFFSGRHYTHYFVPGIWFLCVAAAPLAQNTLSKRGPRMRYAAWILLCLPFVVYSIINTQQESFSSHWTFTRERQFQMKVLGEWIHQNSKPRERISVWGMASQIYVLSERGSATAYIFADFVSGRLPGFKSEVSIPMPGALENYLQQLEKNQALYFIDTSPTRLNDYGAFPVEKFPPLRQYLEQNYQLHAQVVGYHVWKRKISNN